MCLLYLLIVCSFFSYWFVRSDHQSLGCPLSPLDFLTLPSSYLPDSFSSVASISPIFCSGPVPTSPSFCSQLSYLLSMVFLDDLFYLYNSAISTTLIILKSLSNHDLFPDVQASGSHCILCIFISMSSKHLY